MNKAEAYNILGLSIGASDDAIRAAYRALAKQWHPDVNKSPEAEDRLKEINQAYALLTKPQATKTQAPTNPFTGDLWYTFFGGGLGNFNQARMTKSSITLELEDVSPQVVDKIMKLLAANNINVKGYTITQQT